MSSLLRTVSLIWKNSAALTALVPWSKVYVGRLPDEETYSFPNVVILASQGIQTHRTDKTRYSTAPLSFHLWVDDSDLENGLRIAKTITDTYADTCWSLGSDGRVIDVLDMGEPMAHQTNLPNIKAWEIVKLLTVTVERNRADADECCIDASEPSSGQ